ncbi:MAG: hypothetical protein C0609_01150 [Deltaproteobacteria bacterium]|nr:MAG: hypothetical protein C0609_01150 [Deltaproteobacteria bacterium]
MSGKIIDWEKHRKRSKEKAKTSWLAPFYGPRGTMWTFLATLFALLILVAIVVPAYITSSFFAPTAILIAVLLTLWLNRVKKRAEINRMYRQMKEREARENDEQPPTYH